MNDSPIKFPPREFASSRIVFRARDVDQAKELYRLINSNRKHLNPWMPWVESTRAIEHTIQYIEMISSHWDVGKTFDYSIYDKTSKKLIGSFGLHSINWKNKSLHLGYWIDKEFEGKGLITEAIQTGESWAKELGFRRICLTCDALNERSKNTAFRNNYKLEARLIDEQLDRGQWRDTLQFVKFLNDPIEGHITENFPFGFSLKECDQAEYLKLTAGLNEKIYDEKELVLRPQVLISAEDSVKIEKLRENVKQSYKFFAVLFYQGLVAGWTVGMQENAESFNMINSAVLPEYRGRGLYTRMLEITMKKVIDKGYQKICSRHNMLNSKVILAKLKKGFVITGLELNDFAGSLVQLTYFTNPTRKKAMEFRSGHLRPDEELKKLFKL